MVKFSVKLASPSKATVPRVATRQVLVRPYMSGSWASSSAPAITPVIQAACTSATRCLSRHTRPHSCTIDWKPGS